MLKHVVSYETQYPEAVWLVYEQLYVDHELGGADTIKGVCTIIKQTFSIFTDAKMELKSGSPTTVKYNNNCKPNTVLAHSTTLLQNTSEDLTPLSPRCGLPSTDVFGLNRSSIVEEETELPNHRTRRRLISIFSL